MKRDARLVRIILLRAEKAEYPDGEADLNVSGHTFDKVSYHVKIMAEAGLIEAHVAEFDGSVGSVVLGLTWRGHEFLELARDENL